MTEFTDTFIRKMLVANSAADSTVNVDGRQMLCFCSNNYLGLATHPELVQAGLETISEFGVGTGASRFVSGNTSLHEQLETDIAHFESADAGVVFSSGYMANVGTVSALVRRGDVVISDRLNHASIIDGCRLSGAKMLVYPHRNVEALEKIVKRYRARYKRALLVTDTVFSMDGDVAPIDRIAKVCTENDMIFMVDEAHATGVFGKTGRGVCQAQSVVADVHLGTLSKALGCSGGFISGKADLMENIRNRARSFIYTTAMPATLCATASAAIRVLGANAVQWLDDYWKKIGYFKQGLAKIGFDAAGFESQIFPLLADSDENALRIAESFQNEGIMVTAIRPPTVPAGTSRLRLTVIRTHTYEQLDRCLEVVQSMKHLFCMESATGKVK